MAGMRYVGKSGRWMFGVPKRDLSEDEVSKYGRDFLLSSGLYEEIKTDKSEPEPEFKFNKKEKKK